MIDLNQLNSTLEEKDIQNAIAKLNAAVTEAEACSNYTDRFMKEWSQKVRNWLKAANVLANHNQYMCDSFVQSAGGKLPNNCHVMCTDDITHIFGFVGTYDMFRPARSYYDLMGLDGGGCCGNWYLRTNGYKVWMQLGREGKVGEWRTPTSKEWKKLFDALPKFEQKFENLVNELMK